VQRPVQTAGADGCAYARWGQAALRLTQGEDPRAVAASGLGALRWGLAASSAADWDRRALMLPRGAGDWAALDSV